MTISQWVDKLENMSPHKLLQTEDEFLPFTFVLFIALPLGCWICGRLLRKRGGKGPLKTVFLVLITLAALPGILFSLFAASISFFSNEILPDVSIYCYALPFLSFVMAMLLAGANRDLIFKRGKTVKPSPPESAPVE